MNSKICLITAEMREKKGKKKKKKKKKTKRKMPYADNSYPNANEIESETLLVW